MTLSEFDTLLQSQNGTATREQCSDFRNTYWNDATYGTEAWYLGLWSLRPNIDWANLDPFLWYLLKKALIDWLLTDDDASDISGEYDVITKGDGDKVERNIRLNSDLSQAQKNELLLEIGSKAFRIDSSKLQTAIDNVIV